MNAHNRPRVSVPPRGPGIRFGRAKQISTVIQTAHIGYGFSLLINQDPQQDEGLGDVLHWQTRAGPSFRQKPLQCAVGGGFPLSLNPLKGRRNNLMQSFWTRFAGDNFSLGGCGERPFNYRASVDKSARVEQFRLFVQTKL